MHSDEGDTARLWESDSAQLSFRRVYGGLHYDKSSTDSLAYGAKVAAYAINHFDKKWGKPSAFL